MVVPVERLSSPEKIKRYTGNDLVLRFFDNKKNLIVTGNNCKIKLSENSGYIKVVGDNCELTVLEGNGNIEYIGNKGKIKLGIDVPEDVVTYIGNEGEIISAKGSTNNRKINEKQSKLHKADFKEEYSQESHVNICNANQMQYTCFLPSALHISIPTIRISKHLTLEKCPKI